MDEKENNQPIILKTKMNATENKVIASDDYFNIDVFAEKLKHIDRFTKTIKDHLIENSDYGIIAGTKKPTLYKSGAEKILIGLGLTDDYELKEIDGTNEKPARAYYEVQFKCVLYKNDVKVSEGYGSFNSREKAVAKLSVFDVKNRILKMAKKRALTDATLRISGLSGNFTQDLEDSVQPTIYEKEQTTAVVNQPATEVQESDRISKTEASAFYKMLSGDFEQNKIQMAELVKDFNGLCGTQIRNVYNLPKSLASEFKKYVLGVIGKPTEVDINDPIHYEPIPDFKKK